MKPFALTSKAKADLKAIAISRKNVGGRAAQFVPQAI
jgi:hypothetical protein